MQNASPSADHAAVENIQIAGLEFFVPIAAAYLVVCATWWAVRRFAGDQWPDETTAATSNQWIDLAMIVVAIAGVFGIGAAYRAGLLIPDNGPATDGNWSYLVTAINLSLPFLAIFVCLAIRRQSTATVWMTARAMDWKLGTGLFSAILGVLCFCLLRGELDRLPFILSDSITLHSLSHGPAVFLEVVAIAFVFERLRWAIGRPAAIAIPCVLFALAHIPSGIESGRSVNELVAFFAFNCILPAIIFITVMRSRDVIWIALPHYFLDVAMGVFH